jgi:hypothetical protein
VSAWDARDYFVCCGTYPGGRAAPSPKKKSSMCFATSSCASFCHGIRRYSLRIIFMRSSQSFHASAETFSKIRWPSSPGHGGALRPGSSFWNLTHKTLRLLVIGMGRIAGVGPQVSAMGRLYHWDFRVDGENEAPMSRSNGALGFVRLSRAGENEAQVTPALG